MPISATQMVRDILKKKPNPTPEEIKEIAEKVKEKTGRGSPSLVYKVLRKMPAERRMAVKPAEPVVTVEEEPEIIEEPVEEEFDVPSEFVSEEAELVEEEAVEEEVVVEEEEAEEERLLRAISKRAIKRFFGVAIEEGLGLGKELGLTDQEAEDTEVLTMFMIAKYLTIEIKENLLEITSGLHFGSVGLKLLVAWIKKRRREKKAEEEKPVKKPEPVEPEKPEEPLTTEEEAKEDTEAERERKREQAEKAYVKKVTGGN